ncbi:unnamed protein product [Dovyalis caffra]|uniref:Uncharacterized protein n=1 Tax=Dovyalis caffra TaxID=77055 RepID=A0AAV1SL77_9ROSI|nr:unnamed protein product [Dovyalis caffra]
MGSVNFLTKPSDLVGPCNALIKERLVGFRPWFAFQGCITPSHGRALDVNPPAPATNDFKTQVPIFTKSSS